MTTMTTAPLSEMLQKLVDARLDTIDRMLLGRVHRQDRLAIVREVETQIHDLLGDRDPGSLDREDVLAVLARLDPPEAYLPEDEFAEHHAGARLDSVPRGPTRDRGSRSPASRASGVVGLVGIGMIFVAIGSYILAELFDSRILFFVGTGGSIVLAFLLGVIATTLAGYLRLRGAWTIVGLVTGILSLIASLAGGMVVLVAFLG